jgi:hypothetical protein
MSAHGLNDGNADAHGNPLQWSREALRQQRPTGPRAGRVRRRSANGTLDFFIDDLLKPPSNGFDGVLRSDQFAMSNAPQRAQPERQDWTTRCHIAPR